MATAKKNLTTEEAAIINDDRVELRVPRGAESDDPNLFISINGVNFLIPRGQVSTVPKCVAEEYHRMEEAKEQFYSTMDGLLSKE